MLLLIVAAVIIVLISNQYLNYFVEEYNLNSKPLFDIFHRYTPNLSRYYYVVDWMVLIMIIVLFVYGRDHFITFIIMIAYILIFKYLMQLVTILPDPTDNLECKDRHQGISRLFGYCNDMMPSGHTAICIAIAFLLWGTIPGSVLTIYTAVVAYLSVAVRNHYTIDVIVAYLLVFFIWKTCIVSRSQYL